MAAQETPNSPPSSTDRAPRRRGSSLKGLPLRQPSSVESGTAHSLSPRLTACSPLYARAARHRGVRSKKAKGFVTGVTSVFVSEIGLLSWRHLVPRRNVR